MSSIWETPFVVVDVETSGPTPKTNRIIDIACVLVQGGEITKEYHSLVNPHQFIPPYIVKMTGINYKMAFHAPELNDVLPNANEFFSMPGAVFVAHNAGFDWSFIAGSYLLLGSRPPIMPKLCTIKIARRMIEKTQKKNLDALSQYFNVRVKNRHRAYGDAYATALILIEMLDILEQDHDIDSTEELLKFQNRPIRQFKPPTPIYEKFQPLLETLPTEPGVYYFLDKNNNIIYVGKAKSLKNRIRSYFHEDAVNSKKIAGIFRRLENIRWTQTDTELGALLLESHEIKTYKPPFNVLEKKLRSYPFIKITNSQDFPTIKTTNEIINDNAEYYGPFRNTALTADILERINKKFQLRKCDTFIKPNPEHKPCFYSHIERCLAPCADLVTPQEYKQEVEKVKHFLSGYEDSIVRQLENKMNLLSESMQFEKADLVKTQIDELRKLFMRNRNVPTSINNYNLVMILPASLREKTVELFIIKTGKLAYQATLGRKAPLDELFALVHENFFNSSEVNLNFSIEEINSLRIINSWLYSKNSTGKFIYCENKSEHEIYSEIQQAFLEICTDESVAEEESIYDQTV